MDLSLFTVKTTTLLVMKELNNFTIIFLKKRVKSPNISYLHPEERKY